MSKILISFLLALQVNIANAQNDNLTGKLSLNNAIQTAIENHPELKKANYKIESVKGRYYKDISLPQPEFSVGYEYIPTGKGISNFEERTIEIRQQLEVPTIYFLRGSKINAEINSAKSEFNFTKNNIRTSVIKAYYNAVTNKQLLNTAEENYSISEDFVKKAEIRINVGEGTNLELLTAKNQFSEAKANIEIARSEYNSSLYTLNFALGRDSIEYLKFELTDTLSYVEHSLTLDELLAKSYGLNPLLKSAEFNLEATEINKSIGWSKLIPGFNISYLNQSRSGLPNYYGIRLGMNFPLWFFMEPKGQIQENDANYLIASSELQSIKNLIRANIANVFEEYSQSKNQYQIYKDELLPQSEEIFRIANMSYQLGEITYLEFLQAKITFVNTKNNYYKSLFQYNKSLINIEEAVGIQLF